MLAMVELVTSAAELPTPSPDPEPHPEAKAPRATREAAKAASFMEPSLEQGSSHLQQHVFVVFWVGRALLIAMGREVRSRATRCPARS
jgi:hypothetical protein